jgi:hypothetical protein
VVDSGPPGWDISKQLVTVASSVAVSTRRRDQELSAKDLDKKPAIVRYLARTDEIEFADGTVSRFDYVVFCTGYRYDYGFIRNSDSPMFDGDFGVKNIHEHMFYIHREGIRALHSSAYPR